MSAGVLESLRKQAMRWIVRQAFGTDPSELRILLHNLNQAVLYDARVIHDLRRESRELKAEVIRSKFKIHRSEMRCLFVAQAFLNDTLSRHLGVDLLASVCPACLAPEGKPCFPDQVCKARHKAAITRALVLKQSEPQ